MRAIVLDTETTGLDPSDGHRVIEIGAVELINDVPSGEVFHQYINPQRAISQGALEIHGLSEDFLRDHPVFADIADDFLAFIEEAHLIIHNAPFDMGFLNAELDALRRPPLDDQKVIDTLAMAREKFPGAPASLDALCRRFGIDNSARTKHGALLDAELLSEVYLELIGGREPGLELAAADRRRQDAGEGGIKPRAPRPHAPGDAELAAHRAFLETLDDPVWNR